MKTTAICYARRLLLASLALMTAFLPALACAAQSAAMYQDGVYQDIAPGHGDDVIVTVTVRGGRILSLDAKNRNGGESEYFLKARDGIAAALVQTQSLTGLEAVSGATGTSNSILTALAQMLEQLTYDGLPQAVSHAK